MADLDMDSIKYDNEKARFQLLDEAVRDTGIGEIYMIGLTSFARIMHSATPEEMVTKLESYIEWAKAEAGGPEANVIPLLALVSDELEQHVADKHVDQDGDPVEDQELAD